jgi:hypothetical protein
VLGDKGHYARSMNIFQVLKNIAIENICFVKATSISFHFCVEGANVVIRTIDCVLKILVRNEL